MNSSFNTLRILTRGIAPAVVALSLVAAGTALADPAGVALINLKLGTIPGLKAGTTVATAKSDSLLYALTLALDTLPSNATAAQYAALVEAALQKDGASKFRKDKDKIAGQVIATAIANNKITDPLIIAAITKAVFNVNTGDANAALTIVGQGVALSGALKAASPSAATEIGKALGGSTGGEFTGDVVALLSNTAKALGTSSGKAAGSLEAFSKDFLLEETVDTAARKAQAEAAAVASTKTPAAAGSILGGFIGSLGAQTDTQLRDAGLAYVANSKLAKALGDVLAYTMDGHTSKATLLNDLLGASGLKDAGKPLVAQGVLRAGTFADASSVMDAYLATNPDRAKVAGAVVAGNGDNEVKLSIIVSKLAMGQSATAAAIGAAVISSVGVLNPESADAAINALFAGAGITDNTARLNIGVAIAPKVKSYSAVGFMAAGIAELNVSDASNIANKIMSKASKAATDIAYRIADLSSITNKQTFAVQLATANNKFSLNAAVGASLADEANAGAITAAVIQSNKVGVAKAPLIAGAVAIAVDEERASEVAYRVGELISETGAGAKPIKASAFKTLAAALAKAMQTKPNVTTKNRADEEGEQAALLTNAIIQAFGGSGQTDATKIKARNKLITAVGTAILKALSKKPVEESKTLLADQSAAADIAGSIALTISSSNLPADQRTALLATGGILEKAFLKLAGKAGLPDSNALKGAIADVNNSVPAALAGYEDGTLFAQLATTFNDKETDKRNR